MTTATAAPDASIAVDYNVSHDSNDTMDDILTVTTTLPDDTFADESEATLEALPGKETNLNGACDSCASDVVTVTRLHDRVSIADDASQEENVLSAAQGSATTAIAVPKPAERLATLEEADRPSTSSVPVNFTSPVLDRTIPRSKQDRENLHRLLHFVAMIEKAKLDDKEGHTHLTEVGFNFILMLVTSKSSSDLLTLLKTAEH